MISRETIQEGILTDQLVVVELGALVVHDEPPGSSTDGGGTDVAWRKKTVWGLYILN